VRGELVNLAAKYAADGHENVTLSMTTDFQRCLFPRLDEEIRIRDLAQSEEFKDNIIEMLADEYPKEPAWPYLGQLGKQQERCTGKKGCRFKLGAALYRSTSCTEHFLCERHRSSPCCALHKQIPSQDGEANHVTKEAAADAETPKIEPGGRVDLDKIDSGVSSAGEHDAAKKSADEGDLDDEHLHRANAKAISKKVTPAEQVAANEAAHTIASNGTTPSADEVERDFNRTEKDKETLAAPAAAKEEGLKTGHEKLGKKAVNGTPEKGAVNAADRPAKFKVEDVQYYSVNDFSYDRQSLMSEIQVCQLRKKSGDFVWILMDDYVLLKSQWAAQVSGDEAECDNSIVKEEDMYRQNADVGR